MTHATEENLEAEGIMIKSNPEKKEFRDESYIRVHN